MGCEITKPDSKDSAKVIKAIKSYSAALANLNVWTKIEDWKRPADTWYDQVEDGAKIDIETIHNDKPYHHYLVNFVGVPKHGTSKLRVNVGKLPFKKP